VNFLLLKAVASADTPVGLKDFDRAILAIVRQVRPDLLPESRG